MFVQGGALAQSNQCERLFSAVAEINTCNTLRNLRPPLR
jgi:hypothetical protein